MKRPIPGFEGFFADTDGNIYGRSGKMLATRMHLNGREWVQLWYHGKNYSKGVGQLVLLAFVGQPPPGHECCHGPEGRRCHALSNISWGTKSQNNGHDKDRDGTLRHGPRHQNAKLTLQDVRQIRKRYRRGATTYEQLGHEFGVHPSTICYAVNFKTYKHTGKT